MGKIGSCNFNSVGTSKYQNKFKIKKAVYKNISFG